MLAIAERKRNSATTATGCSTREQVANVKPSTDKRRDQGGHSDLSETVGEAQYQEILTVSKEIIGIRARSTVWAKFSQQQYYGEEELRPASESLPTQISDLYFRTRLVALMRAVDTAAARNQDEKVPSIVRRTDWDLLLEDAKTKLAAYKKFVAKNVDENDNPCFFCSQSS